MPLPLTVSCFSKIQIGFTFLVPAYPGRPGKRAVKRMCVLVFGSVWQVKLIYVGLWAQVKIAYRIVSYCVLCKRGLNWTDFIEHTCSLEWLNCWINYTIIQWYRQLKMTKIARQKNAVYTHTAWLGDVAVSWLARCRAFQCGQKGLDSIRFSLSNRFFRFGNLINLPLVH